MNGFTGQSLSSARLLGALPAAIILLFASLEWGSRQRYFKQAAPVVTCLLAIVRAIAAVGQFMQSTEDLRAEAAVIPSALEGDSCVVFASEQLSKPLFLVFEPQLAQRECVYFSHRRVVLASHLYVREEQQQNAESYFYALSFAQ